ncbi:hypothetical protein [Mesobacillus foraminis]|uniref:hypothetical protein n=1 Tax=Mesobacillus foraminis TaxID=279826 RepID=UPI000EF4AC8D|nr:hypothetical protein [Mesobacillus foraminis]
MFKLEFIDQNTNLVFREKNFGTPKGMHEYLNKFNLKDGVQFTFFDEFLNAMFAEFVCITSFIKGREMGFRIYFMCYRLNDSLPSKFL